MATRAYPKAKAATKSRRAARKRVPRPRITAVSKPVGAPAPRAQRHPGTIAATIAALLTALAAAAKAVVDILGAVRKTH